MMFISIISKMLEKSISYVEHVLESKAELKRILELELDVIKKSEGKLPAKYYILKNTIKSLDNTIKEFEDTIKIINKKKLDQ